MFLFCSIASPARPQVLFHQAASSTTHPHLLPARDTRLSHSERYKFSARCGRDSRIPQPTLGSDRGVRRTEACMVRHFKARRIGSRLLASAGFAVLATAAQAADIGSRELPPPRAPVLVPFFTWNGFYVGINAGYGFGHSKWTDTVTGV